LVNGVAAKVKCRQPLIAIARVGWEKILSREVLTMDIEIGKKSILPNSTQIFVIVFAIFFAAFALIGIKNECVRQPRVRSLKALAMTSAYVHFLMFILPLGLHRGRSLKVMATRSAYVRFLMLILPLGRDTTKVWRYWAPLTATYFFLAFLYVTCPGVGRVLVLSALNGACLLYEFTKKIPSSEEFEGSPLGVLLHWLRHVKLSTVCSVVLVFVSSVIKTSSFFE
jgi:hypothetical protein